MTAALLGVTTYAYDALDRVTTMTSPDPDDAGSLTSPVTKFAYDAVGNRVSLTDPASNITTFTYDGLDRLTVTTDPLGQPTTLAYDAADQLTLKTDRIGCRTTYAYDALGRRTHEHWLDGGGAALRTVTYSYGAVGRRPARARPVLEAGEAVVVEAMDPEGDGGPVDWSSWAMLVAPRPWAAARRIWASSTSRAAALRERASELFEVVPLLRRQLPEREFVGGRHGCVSFRKDTLSTSEPWRQFSCRMHHLGH